MANNDTNNMNVLGSDGETYVIRTESILTSAGPTGHMQVHALGYDGGGAEPSIGSLTSPYPVKIPASTTVGNYIQDVWGCIGTAAGGSCMNVDIVSSAGLTINAVVQDLIVGITSNINSPFAQIGVYGTGGTAVGMTGSVYILGVAGVTTDNVGIAMFGSRGATAVGVTGAVTVPYSSISTVGAYGATGFGSSKHLDVGVTGYVGLDRTTLVGVSGGITIASMPTITVNLPDGGGFTNGSVQPGVAGMSFGHHGLSSGIRITAFSTGATTDFVYVGASGGADSHKPEGLTSHGFPLREMDSIFLEIDNMSKVMLVSDNANAIVRYLGS